MKLPHADPIHKVTIIPRGMALGLTMQLPIDEKHNYSREYLEDQIAILLGGRIAEEITIGSITTGAGNDLERATDLARRMVCEWGMSGAMGPLTFGKKEEQIFLGREIAQHQDYSEDTALKIDQEVKRFVTDNYTRAQAIIAEHKQQLLDMADALLARETLDAEQVKRLAAGLHARRPDARGRTDTAAGPRREAARRNARHRGSFRRCRRVRSPRSKFKVQSSRLGSKFELTSGLRRFDLCNFQPVSSPRASQASIHDSPSRTAGRWSWVPGRSSWGSSTSPLTRSQTAASLLDPSRAIEAGVQMAADGADLLDVGGESTRPGAQALDAAEERRRVLPVIEGLARQVNVPISVDTYKASIAGQRSSRGVARERHQRSQVRAGSGRRSWPSIGAPIILMHTRGRSSDMYKQAVYNEVVDEVLDELRESIAFAAGAGIPKESLLVDPGLGFAKEPTHSLRGAWPARRVQRPRTPHRGRTVAKRVSDETACPGRYSAAERDWPTAAAVTAAVLAGAHIVRVHAVREMVPVVRVADEIRKYHREH